MVYVGKGLQRRYNNKMDIIRYIFKFFIVTLLNIIIILCFKLISESFLFGELAGILIAYVDYLIY